jgi:His-Xaa-Ser system radical SAM maturase HxsC
MDLFPYFEVAALLAPKSMTIGISGGEPTLFKDPLFDLLQRVLGERPDLGFHVLTNGQHLGIEDRGCLAGLPRNRVLWGVPLYAAEAPLHDLLVGKVGAFHRLMDTFALLAQAGTSIELRTVVMSANVDALPRLANFVATHLPFVSCWALMQLENIGYGRQNWHKLFFDNSELFGPIAEALNIACARGVRAVLYNFPRCTVPFAYRKSALATISDWKRRYLPVCTDCPERKECGGFFAWYPEGSGFKRLGVQ